jgi:hypothetical protein
MIIGWWKRYLPHSRRSRPARIPRAINESELVAVVAPACAEMDVAQDEPVSSRDQGQDVFNSIHQKLVVLALDQDCEIGLQKRRIDTGFLVASQTQGTQVAGLGRECKARRVGTAPPEEVGPEAKQRHLPPAAPVHRIRNAMRFAIET